jgi:hypothetical protein
MSDSIIDCPMMPASSLAASPSRIRRLSSGPQGARVDGAQGLIEAVLDEPTPEERLQALREVLPLLHAAGITSYLEANTTAETVTAYVELAKRRELTARVSIALGKPGKSHGKLYLEEEAMKLFFPARRYRGLQYPRARDRRRSRTRDAHCGRSCSRSGRQAALQHLSLAIHRPGRRAAVRKARHRLRRSTPKALICRVSLATLKAHRYPSRPFPGRLAQR